MRDLRETVQCWRTQTPVDQQRVMMANEGKAYNTDCLEDAWPKNAEALGCISLELGGDVWAFNEHGGYYDHHTNEGETKRSRWFVDIKGERKGIGNAYRTQSDDELSICEPRQDGNSVKLRKDRPDNMRYCVACKD